jgi:hypothetical protein
MEGLSAAQGTLCGNYMLYARCFRGFESRPIVRFGKSREQFPSYLPAIHGYRCWSLELD